MIEHVTVKPCPAIGCRCHKIRKTLEMGTTAPGAVTVVEVDGVKEKVVGPERDVKVHWGYCVECGKYRDDTVITDSVEVPVDG